MIKQKWCLHCDSAALPNDTAGLCPKCNKPYSVVSTKVTIEFNERPIKYTLKSDEDGQLRYVFDEPLQCDDDDVLTIDYELEMEP